MADNKPGFWASTWAMFGFNVEPEKTKEEQKENKSFALPQNDDGAAVIQSGSYFGTYVDLDGTGTKNEAELITRYRAMSMQPEVENAIDHIINQAIVTDGRQKAVSLNMDDLEVSKNIKNKIQDEFDYILKMLNFNNMGHDIFRRWYVDGRLYYHVIVEEGSEGKGIQELRQIDPRRIRKVREIKKGRDPKTGLEIVETIHEYYIYNERGIVGMAAPALGTKITKDSVVYSTSGLMDANKNLVLSYLNKAIKPLNQLRMLEDATVIYRLARAPERRAFYVDVGNMSTIKAEQYLKNVMTNYRNKLVYDSTTGEIKDDRKFMTMLEDIWLPRREGNKSTEIDTLPGGQSLGKIEDVEYMERKLYEALGIPYSRKNPGTGFSLGRTTEISRDEVNFSKFIGKLRNKFSILFTESLKIQLVLKKICTVEEWDDWSENIRYNFFEDVVFEELKDAEVYTSRLQMLTLVTPYIGTFFSKEWVKKNILRMDEEEIDEILEQIKEEQKENEPTDPETGQPLGMEDGGMPPPMPGRVPGGMPGMPPMGGMGQPNMAKQAQTQEEYDPEAIATQNNEKRKNRFNIPFEGV